MCGGGSHGKRAITGAGFAVATLSGVKVYQKLVAPFAQLETIFPPIKSATNSSVSVLFPLMSALSGPWQELLFLPAQ
jgi:hypothetical protein